jgi:WD40 repeat protein
MKYLQLGYLISVFLALFAGCENLSNRYQAEALYCGKGFQEASDFFTVTDPDGKRIPAEDLSILNLDPKDFRSMSLTANGCLSKPSQGRYLIRSKVNEWAAIISPETIRNRTSIQLQYFGDQEMRIQCTESEAWSVGEAFSIRSAINSQVSQDLEDGFSWSYELKRDGKPLSAMANLNLTSTLEVLPFAGTRLEGSYELTLSLVNKFRNSSQTKKCKLNLDRSAPNSDFAVNSSTPKKSVSIHDAPVVAVNPDDTISFVSSDSDIEAVEYCTTQLDDDFDNSDGDKLRKWKSQIQSSPCSPSSIVSTGLGVPILLKKNAGIWTLHFQSLDKLGNKSAPKSAAFIFLSSDRLNLIKNIAQSDVSLQILQKQGSVAASQALRAESLRLDSVSRFERDESWSPTLAGLLNAFNQDGIGLETEDFGDSTDGVVTLDNNTLISATGKYLRFWDIKSRKNFRSIDLGQSVTKVALSPDKTWVAVSSNYGPVKKVNLDSSETQQIIDPEGPNVTGLAISPDGKRIAISHLDYVQVWNAETNGQGFQLPENTDERPDNGTSTSIKALAWSKDGNYLITGSEDKKLVFWEFATKSKIHTFETSERITALEVSPDNKTLLAGTGNGKIEFWDLSTKKLTRTRNTNIPFAIVQLVFSADGNFFYAASERSTVLVYDQRTAKELKILSDPLSSISSVAVTPDANYIATGSANRSPKIWNMTTGFQPIRSFDLSELSETSDLDLSPNQKQIAMVGGYSEVIEVHDLEQGTEPILLKGDDSIRYCVKFSRDGKFIVSGSYKGVIEFWNLEEKKQFRRLQAHDDSVENLAFSADGLLLFSTSSDKTIKIWDSSTGVLLKTIKLGSSVTGLSVSDKGIFASSQASGQVDIWDIRTWERIKTFYDPAPSASQIAISPDGKKLVLASFRGFVRFWDIASGHTYADRSETLTAITSIHWTNNGKGVFSSSLDQSMRLWDADTGKSLGLWLAQMGGVADFAVSKDGNFLLSGGFARDTKVNVWQLNHRTLTEKLCVIANSEDFSACKN